jgi:FlaA1/EpsC-like NDP-sugar epimerase
MSTQADEMRLTPYLRAHPPAGLRNRHFLAFDVLALPLATILAFAIRFEGLSWPSENVIGAIWFVLFSVPVKLSTFLSAGLYRRVWRHASVREAEQILKAVALSGAVCFAFGAIAIPGLDLAPSRVPLSVLVLDALLTATVITLPRAAVRLVAAQRPGAQQDDARRVRLPGLRRVHDRPRALDNPQLASTRSASDDDQSKHRNRLFNLPVLGAIADLPKVASGLGIDEVIIAMPKAPGSVIREVLDSAAAAGIKSRTVPGMSDIISGRVAVSALRQVEIQDLLRREPVTTSPEAVRALVAGQTVLVTGAGGSIGSELCRQLAGLGPKRIVLVDHAENPTFDILNELRSTTPNVDVVPAIVDVRDRDRFTRVVEEWTPIAVFHAAAHKHVPMMECNVAEAITNNVLGTRNVVEVAARSGVEHLVLISTDKAVHPTSVMGATKRVAEQVVQRAARELGRNYVAVRFGNVLGSSGSVVPTFLRQIAAGGPVTVTHPEMRRYFMTIPESVQLVLQAGTMGKGGEVFVLDMGDPVNIADLAADLIRLSGKEVGTDIEIRYSGIRPGEKLYEELFFSAELAAPTEHPKVLRARNGKLPKGVEEKFSELIEAAQEGRPDEVLRALLTQLVPDFNPSDGGAPLTSARRAPAQTHSS